MCLFDSAVSGGGLAPYFDGVGNSPPARDNSGLYGRYNILTVDGKTRMFGGVGEWPYINQASVEFVAAGFNGSTAVGSAASTTAPNSGLANNFVTYLGTKYYTKNDSGPGFAAAWPTNAANASQPENVAIIPKIQVVYPQGFRNKYTLQGTGGGAATGNFALVDIAVYATGTYKGAPVTYGSLDTVNGTDQTSTSVVADPSGHPYYWGLLDDHPTVSPATGYLCNSVPNPVNSVGANYSATDSYTTINFPTLYIGPFDSNAPVTDVPVPLPFRFLPRECPHPALPHRDRTSGLQSGDQRHRQPDRRPVLQERPGRGASLERRVFHRGLTHAALRRRLDRPQLLHRDAVLLHV